MNKLPLSVSSKLTTINTPLSLTVSSYANETGKTGAEAPVLIAIEAKKTLFADDFAAALPEKGGQGTQEQARLVVNAVASVLQDLVAQYGAITVNTPIGTIETFIAGSLENATDAIDPDVNIPFLGVIAPPEMMKQFAAIQTYVPSSACPAALKRICDKATGNHEIYGTNAFYAMGYGMTFGSAGETMKLLNPLTRADDLVGFSSSNQYVISGCFPEGWKTTDQLIVRSLRDGAVYATMVANEFVNASASDTTKIVLSKLENLSAEPDSEWNNHPAEFVFKRADTEYKHTVSWLNA